MTDFTSIGNTNCQAFSSFSRIVYLEVSSFDMAGAAVSLSRRSRLTLKFPSKPGTRRRTG